jgi:hypothetical protein
MLFQDDEHLFALFLWIVLPLIPVTVFGWYLADVLPA